MMGCYETLNNMAAGQKWREIVIRFLNQALTRVVCQIRICAKCERLHIPEKQSISLYLVLLRHKIAIICLSSASLNWWVD